MNDKRNLMTTILAAAICITVYKCFGILIDRVIDNSIVADFVRQAIFAVMVAIAVVVLKKTWIYRFSPRLLWKGWTSALPLFFLIILGGVNGMDTNAASSAETPTVMLFVAQMLLIGYCEESLFRGMIQNAFHRLFGEDSVPKVILAVALSSVIFGLAHLSNGFEPAIGFRIAAYQAILVIGTGMCTAAIYYRTGKCLWFVIFVHAFQDFVGLATSGRLNGVDKAAVIAQTSEKANIGQAFMVMGFYALIALFLLRPRKIRPLLEDKDVYRE